MPGVVSTFPGGQYCSLPLPRCPGQFPTLPPKPPPTGAWPSAPTQLKFVSPALQGVSVRRVRTMWVPPLGIRVAGSCSSDPSPPIRIPACSESRSPVLMHSLHELTAAVNVILQRRPVGQVIHCSIMGPFPRHQPSWNRYHGAVVGEGGSSRAALSTVSHPSAGMSCPHRSIDHA
jgi:hypothetical protein